MQVKTSERRWSCCAVYDMRELYVLQEGGMLTQKFWKDPLRSSKIYGVTWNVFTPLRCKCILKHISSSFHNFFSVERSLLQILSTCKVDFLIYPVIFLLAQYPESSACWPYGVQRNTLQGSKPAFIVPKRYAFHIRAVASNRSTRHLPQSFLFHFCCLKSSWTQLWTPGEVLLWSLDRGVPRRFLNPSPILGLRKRKLIPF